MKRKTAFVLILIAVLLLNVVPAFAQGEIKVIVNEKPLSFDVPPTIINSRTMVPLRAIFEAIGAEVIWNGAARTVTGIKGSMAVVLKIDNTDAAVNNEHKLLDAPPVIIDGRTLVPVRFISESLGADVNWDAPTRTVIISTVSKLPPKPPVYYAIKAGLEDAQTKIDISEYIKEGTPADEVFSIFEEVLFDNPELFYLAHTGTKYWSNGVLEVAYNLPRGDLLVSKAELRARAQNIVNDVIKPGMTDYEKELALHDYVVAHTKYDQENYKNNTLPEDAFTAYGILMKGTGVCEGYAKAMKMLLDAAGIENLVIIGDATDSQKTEKHAWNLVKLDGEYYHLDTTWDDPTPDRGSRVSYGYFNLNDDQISVNHKWDREKFPKSTGTRYNYFVLNKMAVNNHNEYYFFILEAIKARKTDIMLRANNYDASVYTSNVVQEVDNDPTLSYYARRWYWSVDKQLGVIEITDIEYEPVP